MTFAQRLVAFDATVDRKFDAIRNPAVDKIAYRLSSAADHSLLWHTCGVGREIVRGNRPQRAARLSLALGVESALTNGLVKSVFQRMRPAKFVDLEFQYGLRRPITSAFPSGHATAAFCAATMLGGGPVWYGAATAVAATRIYVRLHYASDVLAGAAFGLALGLALRPFVEGHS